MDMLRNSRLALAGAMPALGECYTYSPMVTPASLPVGQRMAFDISDRGRVALAERFGTGVLRIEGTVVRADSSEYVVKVWRVTQINGEATTWAGEVVHLDPSVIGSVQERTISRPKTF